MPRRYFRGKNDALPAPNRLIEHADIYISSDHKSGWGWHTMAFRFDTYAAIAHHLPARAVLRPGLSVLPVKTTFNESIQNFER